MSFEIAKSLFWIGHASFYLKTKDGTIFIDPYNVSGVKEKADLILITHAHFDHCSKKDIEKVIRSDTQIIAAPQCLSKRDYSNLEVAEPGFKEVFKNLTIEAIPAYNMKSDRLSFHPKQNRWVGYIITIDGARIYHAGDTDFISEMRGLKALDLALLPMGGTYTMDVNEAIEAANSIDSKRVSPIHYKNLLGRNGSELAEKKFVESVQNALLLKEIAEPSFSF
jgi:L-ascorbate metabolism protein UlaG (beta-lactamase superfamily)